MALRVGSAGFGESVTIVRTVDGVPDDHGDVSGGSVTRTIAAGCAVAPLKLDEDASADGSTIIDGFTVYLPAGVDVIASDMLEVRGAEYHVDGVPGVWVNPYNAAHPRGVEVVVRRS